MVNSEKNTTHNGDIVDDAPVATLDKEERRSASATSSVTEGKSPVVEKEAPLAVDQEESSQEYALQGVSWKLQLAALFCVVFLAMGEYVADASLAPLKSTLKKEIPSVTNARYGAISSASHLIKGFLPIIAGLVVDYYGPSYISLGCTTLLFIGAIVRAVGGQNGSFGAILGGEIIASLGAAFIDGVQNKLYTHWFRGTKANGGNRAFLGFVLGIDLAGRNIFQLLGSLTAIPLAESTGKWYWSFWLGSIVCALSVGVNIVYLIIERKLPQKARVPTGRQRAQEQGRAVEHETGVKGYMRSHLKGITASISTMPSAFYLMAMTQVFQSGVIGAFNSNKAEVIEVTRGTTKLVAGYTSSLSLIIPIVMTPLVGLFFDRFGKRMIVGAGQASLWVLVMILLAYTRVHPLLPIILSSFCSSAQLLPFYGSIPIIVQDQISIATAFGIWKSFNSNGSTIIDLIAGAVQDSTASQSRGKANQYDLVFAFLIAIKGWDILLVVGYYFIDKFYFAGILNLSEKARVQKQLTETEQQFQAGLRKSIKPVTYAAIAMFLSLLVAAYTVFIVFSWKS
ncbi:unnamed protein product [Sympodiomycopsis kandeliae]